jgi:hypothetical protein
MAKEMDSKLRFALMRLWGLTDTENIDEFRLKLQEKTAGKASIFGKKLNP